MKGSDVVYLRLLRDSLRKFSFTKEYTFLFIDKSNYESYLLDLLYISKLMKLDFDWDGIPDEETLHKRFNNHSICLLSFYNNLSIGWIWGNKQVTPFWEDSIMNLNDGEIYVGGAYLSKTIDRPKNSGQVFYSIWFDYFINKMNNDVAYSYIDKWNSHSLKLAYNIGMEKYDFIK